MSLSEAPSAKITYNTANIISDEILGGTVTFCRETGYRPNIMMYTFFWCGFLFCAKEQLNEYGLIDNVLDCYTTSLRKIFPSLSQSEEKSKDVDSLCKEFWNKIVADFPSLNSEYDLSLFFEIADDLNNQNQGYSNNDINVNSHNIFSRISSTINSSIYGIIHHIDSGFTIQYRFILDENRFSNVSMHNNATHSTYARTNTIPNNNQSRKKNSPLKIFFIIIAIILAIGLVGNIIPESKNELEPVTEPRSGYILSGAENYYGSEITIKAHSSESCVVKLKTSGGTTRLSFYVRAGDTVTVGVPAEQLNVYFASGDTWYGENDLFGEYTSYYKDSSICDFTNYTWEYTLYPVSNGNFSQTPIDEDEF